MSGGQGTEVSCELLGIKISGTRVYSDLNGNRMGVTKY